MGPIPHQESPGATPVGQGDALQDLPRIQDDPPDGDPQGVRDDGRQSLGLQSVTQLARSHRDVSQKDEPEQEQEKQRHR